MPSLQVREVPERIYQHLKNEAKKEHRSISQEAIAVLSKAFGIEEDAKKRREKIVQRIMQAPMIHGKKKTEDPEKLIREDRDR